MNFQAFTHATMASCYLVLAVCALIIFESAEAKMKTGQCEVCTETLKKIEKTITKTQRDEGREGIEKAIRKYCKSAKTKEYTFCYFIGGTADAATGTLGEISKRLVNFVPEDKICERLNKLDSQICELEYEKQLDLDSLDLKKLKVKELKNILSVWDEDCKACSEKMDFIKRIEQLKPKHYKKKAEL